MGCINSGPCSSSAEEYVTRMMSHRVGFD